MGIKDRLFRVQNIFDKSIFAVFLLVLQEPWEKIKLEIYYMELTENNLRMQIP